MSEGFPPFKPQAARPKGVIRDQGGNELRTELPAAGQQPQKVLSVDFVEPVAAEKLYEVEHITVCAKCGSREVREAILVDGEVYVKL